MRKFAVVVAAGFLFFANHIAGQQPSAPVKDEDLAGYVAGVTERGRDLYAYDQAAWHGTDAFFAIHPDKEGLAHYICMKTPGGWVVVFPKWNATHDRLLVAYEAHEVSTPENYIAVKYDPPREGPDNLVAKERALELAIGDFQAPQRPYNAAILPAESGNIYVYLYPAATNENVWPLGGDVRYSISADGRQIIEKRQLHKTILDMQFDPGKPPVAGYHTHILSDVPEDTDVLYVLTRRPLMPEYVGAGKHIFIVSTDGSIEVEKK